jgi:hypothetical protein
VRGVKIEVQLQHIHTCLADKAELAALGVRFDERDATTTLCNGFFAGGVALKGHFPCEQTS